MGRREIAGGRKSIMSGSLGFLQARMGSTRLPGKVLKPIRGLTILERAIRRLQAASLLDAVVVLTTTREEDDAVAAEARRIGVEAYRGPDLDVLARFCQAADIFKPEVIVRATADNPLIDIGSVDRILHMIKSDGLDYCMEQGLPVGAATEAVTRRALGETDRLGLLPHHREHVTIYIKEHMGDFRTALPVPPDCLRRPDVRITVDTPDDFAFVRDLISRIPEGDAPVPLSDYLRLIPIP